MTSGYAWYIHPWGVDEELGGRYRDPNPSAPGVSDMIKTLPSVEIEYCTQCRWMLRAAWTAQELLTTFQDDLGQVALIPGKGGIFEVRVDSQTIWSYKEDGGFPQPKELKQRVRDLVAPGRSLGHADR